MYNLYRPQIFVDTIVIGAGPSGLATSYLLLQKGIQHWVLEKENCVASSWGYLWDNFRLAMPAREIDMPGEDAARLYGKNTHLTRDELRDFFTRYAVKNELPIRYSCEVYSVLRNHKGLFYIFTKHYTYVCQNVVCCIGPRQEPKIPHSALKLIENAKLKVLHSSRYRTTAQFQPTDNILVIGSGVSALSIAYDIARQGYGISLACGYDDAELIQRHKHLYESNSDRTIVPTLASLAGLGVKNYGRFVDSDDETIYFSKDHQSHELPLKTFQIIIFATGFEPAFGKLKQLLSVDSSHSIMKSKLANGKSHIPHLYIGGIPEPKQHTVIISEGTRHAQDIVKDIALNQLEDKFVKLRISTKAKL